MSDKLYLIGNSHIDPVWLWRWQEGFSEILATFRSALDRMKDFPDFKFTCACAVYYEFVEKLAPDMFEEIRQRVKEGRWNIVGGMFLQPDCNIPDGESLARHLLISQRYFYERFGVTAKTGYNVDSFGHNAGLPKILRAGGMENYVFMRPSPQEQGREEQLFVWESDDGSYVNAYRIPHLYNIDLRTLDRLEQIEEKIQKDHMPLMAFYGVGNHGGGPTIQLIDAINSMNLTNAVYSTPDEYFDTVEKKNLPVVKGDLQHHARGCYSASAYVKRANRECEQNLLAAEKLCLLAKRLTGRKYPAEKLQKAWKNLMFNQFHDILGGCSIKRAYTDASYLFGEVMSITEQEMYFAMQSVACRINTLQGEILPAYKNTHWKIWEHEALGTPVVIFNPHTWTVRSAVAINQKAKKITDYKGREIDFQLVRGDQTNGTDKYHTAFIAEVPAMGYAVYRLFAQKESERNFENELKVTKTSLENSRLYIEFDEASGEICKMYDKARKKTLIDTLCQTVLLDETECDTWAHGKLCLGQTVGVFGSPAFEIIEHGGVRATLRITVKYNDSTVQRDYSVLAGSEKVTIKTKIDFHEKHRTLKFTFPMCDETVISKIPYGTIKKHGYTGEEPCGSWIASGGLAVANDSKHGYDTENGQMRMTVLRSAIYADHYGKRDELCEYMEQGLHEFSYSLFPYLGNSDAERKASELNFGLLHLTESFHDGDLSEYYCGFESNVENTIVSCIKEAYDGGGAVLRLYEMEGLQTEQTIRLFDKDIQKTVEANSVLTVSDAGKELTLVEF